MSFETFLDDVISADVDTVRQPLPIGTYRATLSTDPETAFSHKSGEKKDGTPWLQLRVGFTIHEPITAVVDEAVHRLPMSLTWARFIELDENEQFNPHNNRQLGQLLKALGAPCNLDGSVKLGGKSIRGVLEGLLGNECQVLVGHRTNKDTGAVYDEIQRVTSA